MHCTSEIFSYSDTVVIHNCAIFLFADCPKNRTIMDFLDFRSQYIKTKKKKGKKYYQCLFRAQFKALILVFIFFTRYITHKTRKILVGSGRSFGLVFGCVLASLVNKMLKTFCNLLCHFKQDCILYGSKLAFEGLTEGC